MAATKEDLLAQMAHAVVEMEEEQTAKLAEEYLQQGYDCYDAISLGLTKGMDKAGQLFEEEEYFVPELLLCSDAMYAGLEVLQPHLQPTEIVQKQKIVLGVVEGDTHDIGKNLVKIMLETAGFEVVDLGRDTPAMHFIEKAKELEAQIIAVSTLMTTTMDGMEEIMRLIAEENLQDKIKVMVGGGPISRSFATKIGAHYAEDASKAAAMAKQLTGMEGH